MTGAVCSLCGSNVRLRFDREAQQWRCVGECGAAKPRKSRRRRREPLFSAYLVDNGTRRRATREELQEMWRLWRKHADIREGRVHA